MLSETILNKTRSQCLSIIIYRDAFDMMHYGKNDDMTNNVFSIGTVRVSFNNFLVE